MTIYWWTFQEVVIIRSFSSVYFSLKLFTRNTIFNFQGFLLLMNLKCFVWFLRHSDHDQEKFFFTNDGEVTTSLLSQSKLSLCSLKLSGTWTSGWNLSRSSECFLASSTIPGPEVLETFLIELSDSGFLPQFFFSPISLPILTFCSQFWFSYFV